MRRRFALVQLPTRLLQSQKRKFTGLVAVQQVEESNIKETQKFPSFQCASQKCHNCGKPVKPVQTVNSNSRFLHCSECNSLFATASGADNLNKWNALKSSSTMSRRPPYPSEISTFLDKFVVGQEEAKKSLSVGIYQHYRRLANNAEHKMSTSAQNYLSQSNVTVQNAPGPGAPMELNYRHGHGDFNDSTTSQKTHLQTGPVFRSIPTIDTSIKLDKSNILLLGPSGVGKTYVTQVLAKILDVPIALCDCTSMTQAGYVGEDVENCCAKLLQNAQGNVERAQQGIVFLDEIDKIAAAGDSHAHAYRDVSGEGVQHALLKLVEGTVVNVKSGRKGPGQQDTVQMDTTDVLFVGSGAFGGLEKIVGQRLDKRSVGFGSSSLIHSVTKDDKDHQLINEKRDKLFSEADQGDLIKFGIVPELVGRFPVLVPFHSFNRQMLVRVLSEPANSLLAQMKYQFAMDGVDLEFDQDSLEEIAQLALERKTGARALRSIVEKVLLAPKYDVPGSDIEMVRVTSGAVKGKEQCIYKRKIIQSTTDENDEEKDSRIAAVV